MAIGYQKFCKFSHVVCALVFLLHSFRAESQQDAAMPTLESGDVVLITLNCYSCRIISSSTQSPYNHSGLVLTDLKTGKLVIAQALMNVHTKSPADFLKQAENGATIMVRRSKELMTLQQVNPEEYLLRIKKMEDFFATEMSGRPFDKEYLWNNTDEHQRELLYCSEMVQKTLDQALDEKLPLPPMDFRRQWDFWYRYFEGHVPQGSPGNSPGSLASSPNLETLFQG